jgi:hypothetical protein
MNQHPSEKFVEALAGVAEMTGTTLSEFIVEVFLRAIEPYGFDKGIGALKTWAYTNRRFPAPADLVEIIQPAAIAEVTDEDEATVAASRCIKAVSKFGHQITKEGLIRVKDWIGELGWAILEANGGFNRLCEGLKENDVPAVRAQFRREGIAIISRLKAGHDSPPALPPAKDEPCKMPHKNSPRQLSRTSST